MRESLEHERALMDPIRKLADMVIDTSQFNVHELRQFVNQRFRSKSQRPLLVSLVSFGYKFGVPTDADLMFDVRFLPNPHFVPKLRRYTGRDRKVRRYIQSFPADRRIPPPDGRAADLPDSPLHRRGQKLPDDRVWVHGGKAPLGDDGGMDEEGAGEAWVCDAGLASGHR